MGVATEDRHDWFPSDSLFIVFTFQTLRTLITQNQEERYLSKSETVSQVSGRALNNIEMRFLSTQYSRFKPRIVNA